MARQRGIIKIKGKVGDLSFYKLDGEDFVRQSGGVDKARLLNDPAFKRTRENMVEFGGSATVGKAFRSGLSSIIKSMSDRKMVGRLVKVMRTINNNHPGTRGQRPFEISNNKILIEGFEFNQKISIDSVFNAPYTLVANADRNEVTLDIPDFDTDAQVLNPPGATHFKIMCAITAVSDFVFNPTIRKYEAVVPDIDKENALSATSEIVIGGMVGASTTLTSVLPSGDPLPAQASLICCIGIEFYQKIGGTYYLLATDNAMKVDRVF